MSKNIAIKPRINLTKFIFYLPSKNTYKVEKIPPVKSQIILDMLHPIVDFL